MIWNDDMIWCDIYDMKWYDIRYDVIYDMKWNDMIYLPSAIGLPPGDSRTVHIYTQTIHRTKQIITEQQKQLIWNSADRATSLRVLPWHLPYNWGKSTGKPQSG